jgi:hypothetical protein
MSASAVAFELVWHRWALPLAGRRITGLNGLTNDIVAVDWNGVDRVSRSNLPSRIPIAPFQWTFRMAMRRQGVSRKAINRQFPHRYSSGVQLVMEQIPIFEATARPAVIKLRSDWKSEIRGG